MTRAKTSRPKRSLILFLGMVILTLVAPLGPTLARVRLRALTVPQDLIPKVRFSLFYFSGQVVKSQILLLESGVTSCIPARAGYYIPSPKATTETACKSGTYSSTTGSTSCGSCPPGYMCPNNALASPQRCSPGRYSTGGLTDCTRCGAGTFNNIQGATGCCDCAAGWFNVSVL